MIRTSLFLDLRVKPEDDRGVSVRGKPEDDNIKNVPKMTQEKQRLIGQLEKEYIFT